MTMRAILLPVIALTLLSCQAIAADYHVGPDTGQLAHVNDVPWESLGAGDTVYIHYRTLAQGGDYHEKIFLTTSGSAASPLRIIGVSGPNGERPVLNGANATSRANYTPYDSTCQNQGVVVMDYAQNGSYNTSRPEYIQMDGLRITGALPTNTFKNASGQTDSYAGFSASIYMRRGKDITMNNMELDGSGLGLFTTSIYNPSGDGNISRNITLENSYIHGNGLVGNDREHNIYVQSVNVQLLNNRFGSLLAGSGGSNLKLRSANVLIEGNYIENGARQLDLVEPEDWDQAFFADPNYRNIVVRNNVLRLTHGQQIANPIHIGYDNVPELDRKGIVDFSNNTIITEGDRADFWRLDYFKPNTADDIVNFSQNVLLRIPANPSGAMQDFWFISPNTSTELLGTVNIGLGNYVGGSDSQCGVYPGNSGTITGFSNLNYLPAKSTYNLDLSDPYSPTYGRYVVSQAQYQLTGAYIALLRGDANGNGTVSFADYQILESNFGETGMGWAQGDFDNNGVVNFADYQLLEANFGKSSVPEPATLSLLVLGGLALVRRRRCRP